MNKIRIYNDNEIRILLSNPNVERIKNKSQIIYKNDFKLWAVKEKIFHNEKTAREIFVSGGFDMNILDDRTPQKRLYCWMKKYQKFGEDYFNDKNKYSYKALNKECNITDADRHLIEYIKKVISKPDFLAFLIYKDEDGKIRVKDYSDGKK